VGRRPAHQEVLPTFDQIAKAAAALPLSESTIVGSGRAWAAFASRAQKLEKTHKVRVRPGPIWVYAVRNGLIWNRHKQTIDATMNARCSEDMSFATHPFGPRRDEDAQELVILLEGPLKGRGLRPNAATLALTPMATPVSEREPVPFPSRIDLTSPGLPEPGLEEPVDLEDPALLDSEASRVPAISVPNGTVDEPMLPFGAIEPEDETKLGGN
jgi:hypothetical protein